MSQRVPPGAGALRPIDRTLLDVATAAAQRDPRRRAILRYHELDEPLQRMLNAVEPGSYVRPHRHADPPKVESFILLRGRAAIIRFDDAGTILEVATLAAGGPQHGVEIPPGAWHMLLALEPGTVFYETKNGPYDPTSDKDFAPWAPAEGDRAADAYLAAVEARLHLPVPVDDEEDDLL
ncbi:MAG TPA: WbuC family cupin fold metalloprotein [Chloroflexia bacterium]|nr:WbuC family cupin fold metalloprotein [Chloroflexia bacterium]